ncbi:hypothetical protein PCASD_24868 [Puccinia coronata f. sp. avenae]|uniref:Uncharacterized protein n=1 Tax=Puccinia coronata f. sp. avenae TaxID=200324 RepID=A0A2N5S2G5_9BASI|nr:hypothetical protein PCASD_24868 [Puccinia coronata f. sp. avenae]
MTTRRQARDNIHSLVPDPKSILRAGNLERRRKNQLDKLKRHQQEALAARQARIATRDAIEQLSIPHNPPACGGCTPSQPGVQTPTRPPPHATRRPHAYKWCEDGRLGVRPRRTGVLAMHACPEGVQALHALRTGVHGRHACPARLTGLRKPGRTGVPAVHACPEGVQGLHALQTGVHGQHACPAGPYAEPAVLTPFVGVRHAGVCTPAPAPTPDKLPIPTGTTASFPPPTAPHMAELKPSGLDSRARPHSVDTRNPTLSLIDHGRPPSTTPSIVVNHQRTEECLRALMASQQAAIQQAQIDRQNAMADARAAAEQAQRDRKASSHQIACLE